MAASSHEPLNRRAFLRLVGTSGAALALLGACRSGAPKYATLSANSTPNPVGSLQQQGVALPVTLSQGGTVKWTEFFSTMTPEQENTTGTNAARGLEWMANVVRQFEADNRGWKVQIEPVRSDQLDQRLAVDFNANTDHDLVFSSPEKMARHRKLGDLLDLTPYVQGLSRADVEDLNWNAVWQAASVGGQQLGLPISLYTYGLAYNREQFKKAGIPDRPFQSLDMVIESARKLANPGESRWGLGACLGPGKAAIEGLYAPLVWHFGGDLFDATKKVATLASPANQQAAEWLLALIYTHKVLPATAFTSDGTASETMANALARGEVAQALGFGSYWLGSLQKAGMVSNCVPAAAGCQPGRAGVMAMPTATGGVTSGLCLSVHSLSRQPEMAFRLLQVALRPENLRSCPDGGFPVRLSVWDGAEYRPAFYQTWLAAVRSGRPVPATPYYEELAGTISVVLSKILARSSEVGDALQRAEDQWNSRYAGE